ncbi:MAG: nicotinate-nucleotide--dimethylbenzimidazole phosphoribosyltransferase, partial [Lentisphaerae bacterium]
MSGLLEQTIKCIEPVSAEYRVQAQKRCREQAKPAGSLGMIEAIGIQLAAIRRSMDIHLRRRAVVTCAGDHGVVAEGVSQFPQEVTPKMVYNFVNGGASINALARACDTEVYVADLGVNHDFESELPIFHVKVARGTANMTQGPAMTRDQAVQAVEAGIRIVDELCADDEKGALDI